MISAVLLAAGESRRMGKLKQLLPLGESSFVEHCADRLIASRVDEVIVVTGHREREIRRALANRSVTFAHNATYQSGMTSSIQCGLRAANPNAEAIIIALVDQPRIRSETINQLVDAFQTVPSPAIVIPSYQGRNGHPILLNAVVKDEVLALRHDESLRQVVAGHASQVDHVEVSDSAVVEDFDLPQDYERLVNQ